MLIIAFAYFDPKVSESLVTKLGTKPGLVGFETRIRISPLNALGHSNVQLGLCGF